MNAQTVITRKAIDKKEFTLIVREFNSEDGIGWGIDSDFVFQSKTKAVANAKNTIREMVLDYEYDNDLR